MEKKESQSKCDSCRYLIYEADGGDGNPAIYCSKMHWSGWDDVEAQEFEQGLKGAGIDIWANCEDYKSRDNPALGLNWLPPTS